MSIKARFRFVCEASATENKTSIINVTEVQLLNQEEIYVFPPKLQHTSLHPELCAIQNIKTALKSITKRNQYRNIKVTLPDDIAKLYIDSDENLLYRDHYLEEWQEPPPSPSCSKFVPPSTERTLQSLVKDMVLEKFTGKNQNVVSWLVIFERECRRMEIAEVRYPEVLRLFLENSGSEWFSLTLKVMAITDSWESWKESMIDAFGDRGWSDVVYAFTFRYTNGTLNEYTLKKLNLLLDVEPTMSVKSRIYLTVLGLPPFVRDRLHRKSINTQNELLSEINQLESLVRTRPSKFYTNTNTNTGMKTNTKNAKQNNYKTCSLCEKAGYPGRFHPEAVCRNNPKNKKNDKNAEGNIKLANNAELENDLNKETDQKN